MISNKKMQNKTIKAVFELKALTKSGFMPALDECEICARKSFGGDMTVFFDFIGGNLLCGDCIGTSNQTEENGENEEKSQRKLARISEDTLSALRFITTARDEKLFSFSLHEDIMGELSRICEKYLLEQLGMNMDSLKYYKTYENQ
ncbi:MAG: DNA repair protein RecO C-terminal domain-containing protein [Oscillospiraceae bacterium]|nr:DNA repair protein RecO C-terminal domain-containing protein [Oscillospiraceae bacterium]